MDWRILDELHAWMVGHGVLHVSIGEVTMTIDASAVMRPEVESIDPEALAAATDPEPDDGLTPQQRIIEEARRRGTSARGPAQGTR